MLRVNTARPAFPLLESPLLPSSPFPALVNIVNNGWGILGLWPRRPPERAKPGSERSPERPAESTSRRPQPPLGERSLGGSKICPARGLSLARRRVWAGVSQMFTWLGGTTQWPKGKACLDPGFLFCGLPIHCVRALGSSALQLRQRAQPRCGRSSQALLLNLPEPQLPGLYNGNFTRVCLFRFWCRRFEPK